MHLDWRVNPFNHPLDGTPEGPVAISPSQYIVNIVEKKDTAKRGSTALPSQTKRPSKLSESEKLENAIARLVMQYSKSGFKLAQLLPSLPRSNTLRMSMSTKLI